MVKLWRSEGFSLFLHIYTLARLHNLLFTRHSLNGRGLTIPHNDDAGNNVIGNWLRIPLSLFVIISTRPVTQYSWESKLKLKRGNHVGIFIVLPFTFLKNLKLRHFKSQLSKDNKEIYRKAWKELFRTLGVRSFEIIQIRIQDHLDHGASNKPLHPILTRETDLCRGFVYPVGSKTYFEELGTRRIDMKIRPT